LSITYRHQATLRRQIGQIQGIAQHMVAIEAQQWIAVEEDRGDAADEGDDEGRIAHDTGLDECPQDDRKGRDHHFHHDACPADHQALEGIAEG
jgi:hypothetical protein